MISEEENKELEELKSLLYRNSITQYGKRKLINLYENLIEKQQKVANLQEKTIQLMADYIKDIDDCINSEFNSSEFMGYNVQEIIEYFRNKAKESE